MASIVVRCKMCKHTMKFAAEKAGKRAKCTKCDAIVLIQAEEEAKKPEPAPVAVAEGAPPVAPKEEEESYGVYTDPELEQRKKELLAEEEAKKKQKKKKDLPKVARKVKAIPDADAWAKVRVGLLFHLVGCIIWLGTHLLQGSYVLLGSTEFSEYATHIAERLQNRGGEDDFPPPGRFWDIDILRVHLGMIAGRAFESYAWVALIVASLLYFVQAGFFTMGYFCFLAAPRRFGMFGQTMMMIALAAFNVLFAFIFKLLPALGAHGYVLIPYVTPEIVMTEYNMERTVPIHIIWSGAPFWENIFHLILRFAQYFEPMFACVFLWSAGVAVKDEDLASRGRSMTEILLGTFFVFLCFTLLSLCGASPVLVNLLRIIYGLWFGFLAMYIASYAGTVMKFRSVLYDKIHPKNELKVDKKKKDDDDDDDDDDDEDDDDD